MHGHSSPLLFSTSGGMGTTATVRYKRIASQIAEKHSKPYNKRMHSLDQVLGADRCQVYSVRACALFPIKLHV